MIAITFSKHTYHFEWCEVFSNCINCLLDLTVLNRTKFTIYHYNSKIIFGFFPFLLLLLYHTIFFCRPNIFVSCLNLLRSLASTDTGLGGWGGLPYIVLHYKAADRSFNLEKLPLLLRCKLDSP